MIQGLGLMTQRIIPVIREIMQEGKDGQVHDKHDRPNFQDRPRAAFTGIAGFVDATSAVAIDLVGIQVNEPRHDRNNARRCDDRDFIGMDGRVEMQDETRHDRDHPQSGQDTQDTEHRRQNTAEYVAEFAQNNGPGHDKGQTFAHAERYKA